MERSDYFVERSDYLWNEVTIFWNEVTVRWNEVTWNEVTMERSDRNSFIRQPKDVVIIDIYILTCIESLDCFNLFFIGGQVEGSSWHFLKTDMSPKNKASGFLPLKMK